MTRAGWNQTTGCGVAGGILHAKGCIMAPDPLSDPLTTSAETLATLQALEGRVLAHRAFLSFLVTLWPRPAQQEALDWLAQRQLPMDGQEDPGAVPVGLAGGTLAMADEYHRLLDRLRPDLPPGQVDLPPG